MQRGDRHGRWGMGKPGQHSQLSARETSNCFLKGGERIPQPPPPPPPFMLRLIMEFAPFLSQLNALTKTTRAL